MEIEYRTKKLERICTDAFVAKKEYSIEMAERIQMRIDQIRSSESIEFMVKFKIGRCHVLKGNRAGQYAIDLIQPYRLIFEKKVKKLQSLGLSRLQIIINQRERRKCSD